MYVLDLGFIHNEEVSHQYLREEFSWFCAWDFEGDIFSDLILYDSLELKFY
jgi:hypothetical protein